MRHASMLCAILSVALLLGGCGNTGGADGSLSGGASYSSGRVSATDDISGAMSEAVTSTASAATPPTMSPSCGVTSSRAVTPTPDTDVATPCIIATKYPVDDVVIADIVATNRAYGADPTGKKDSTQAIQKALNDCSAWGGGTVWLPAGKYLVTGSISIPPFVTLRGDWQDPDTGNEYGTIILAQPPSRDAATPALFRIGGSAGVMGLTVYYTEQDIDNVKPYPFTFYISGAGLGNYMLQSIINCTVINGYRGVGACVKSGELHEMMTIDTLKGTFLSVGAQAYNQADVGTWKNVVIDNKYWANAGAGLKKADRNKLDAYTRKNATGLVLGDLEWTQFFNLNISGRKIGIHIVKGRRIEFAGSLFDVTVKQCDTGILVDNIDERWGMVIGKGHIEGSVRSVENRTRGAVKLAGVTLSGATSGSNITNETVSLAGVAPDYNRRPSKPKARLFTVSADRTGKQDVSAVLQKALDLAGDAGGGVVYLPAGKYLLARAVDVPAGVELRGASSVAQREQAGLSKGTLILARHGESDSPNTADALITLKSKNAGVRGLRILYPDNSFLSGVKKYSYAIRGRASDVYVVNVAVTAAYNGVDFRDCDGHFIKKLVGCAYNNMIVVGGSGGHIEGCLQNGNALYRKGVSLPGWPTNEANIWKELFDPILRKNAEYIRLLQARNQTVLNVFAYGVRTLIVSEDSAGVTAVNIGADNIGSGSPLLRTFGGSFTGVNIMRYNGISFLNAGTALKLYNRLTINDKNEPTVQQ